MVADTPFLQTAKSNSCTIVDGVEMLVQLAMQMFTQWTRVKVRRSGVPVCSRRSTR